MTDSHTNSEFLNWLQQDQDYKRLEFCSLDDEFLVNCPDVKSADRLWRSLDWKSHPPALQQKRVVIRVNNRLYAATNNVLQLNNQSQTTEDKMQTQTDFLSSWARANPLLFKRLEGCAIVYSTDRDKGFPCLAAKYEFAEKQFNRRINELIGQPLSVWAEAIAMPRRQAIEQFLETGEEQQVSYENRWQDMNWLLHNRVFSLAEGEVIVTVKEGDCWQTGYWQNYAKSLKTQAG